MSPDFSGVLPSVVVTFKESRPEKFVRPKAEVYNVAYEPPANQLELGAKLVKEYGIHTRTSCSTCHR